MMNISENMPKMRKNDEIKQSKTNDACHQKFKFTFSMSAVVWFENE